MIFYFCWMCFVFMSMRSQKQRTWDNAGGAFQIGVSNIGTVIFSKQKPFGEKWCNFPEANIFAPENGWLEYVGILVSFWDGLFSGAFAVTFREGNFLCLARASLHEQSGSRHCLGERIRHRDRRPGKLDSPESTNNICRPWKGVMTQKDHQITCLVGHQTMQMYGKFEGFPFNSALFGLVILMTPV